MPRWFPRKSIPLLVIIHNNLVTAPKSLAMTQELSVPGAAQAQNVKVPPRHSEPVKAVNGGSKKSVDNWEES